MEARMERWEKVPEFLRWILFVPAVLFLWILINVLQLAAMWVAERLGFGNSSHFWFRVTLAAVSASVVFPVAFAPAPRGRKVAGWCFFVPLTTLNSVLLILLLIRRLGSWGLLGDALRPPEGVSGWEPGDWDELAGVATWLIAGSISFHSCLQRENDKARRGLPARVAPSP
jgi:hypothetical protein